MSWYWRFLPMMTLVRKLGAVIKKTEKIAEVRLKLNSNLFCPHSIQSYLVKDADRVADCCLLA
jgi:hypothetical protein